MMVANKSNVKKFVKRRAVWGPSIKSLSSNVDRYAGSNPSFVKRAGSEFADIIPPKQERDSDDIPQKKDNEKPRRSSCSSRRGFSRCSPLIVDCALFSGTASSPSALRQSLPALLGLHPLMAFLFHLQLSQETYKV